MLIRPHDATDDDERVRAFLADQGFGHFVAAGVGHAVPVVVPTQYVVREDALLFHLSASNPVWDRLRENPHAVMSVAGDWAYIPGRWKAIGEEDPRKGIPTTYYGAVQVTGRVEIAASPEGVAETLRHQLAVLEPGHDYVDPLEHGPKLAAIRGLSLPLTLVRAKFKYGGNVDLAHRGAVAAHLEARDGPADRAARAHIKTDP